MTNLTNRIGLAVRSMDVIKIIRILFIETSNEDFTGIDKQGIDEEISLEAVLPPTFMIQRHLEADIKCQISYKNL